MHAWIFASHQIALSAYLQPKLTCSWCSGHVPAMMCALAGSILAGTKYISRARLDIVQQQHSSALLLQDIATNSQAASPMVQEAEGKGAKGKRSKEEVQQRNKAVSLADP